MSKIFRDTENHEAKQDLLFLSSQANCKIAFFFVLFLVTSVTTRRSDSQNGFGSQELCSIAVLTLKPIIFLLLSFSTLEPPKKWLQMIISCYCSFWEEKKGDNLILESSTLPSLQKRQSLLLLLRFWVLYCFKSLWLINNQLRNRRDQKYWYIYW